VTTTLIQLVIYTFTYEIGEFLLLWTVTTAHVFLYDCYIVLSSQLFSFIFFCGASPPQVPHTNLTWIKPWI